MSASDWYRRVLGGGGEATGAAPPPHQPNLPPTSVGAPAPYAPYGAYQAPPQQQFYPGQAPSAPPRPTTYTEAIDHMNRYGWKGGDGTRTERFACPRCHSNLFFTRVNAGRVMGHPPAPRCMECGWNGLFEQFGERAAE